MRVKYCRRCSGEPFTIDTDMRTCPICGSPLFTKNVDSVELEGRLDLSSLTAGNTDQTDNRVVITEPKSRKTEVLSNRPERRMQAQNLQETGMVRTFFGDVIIRGQVHDYINSDIEGQRFVRTPIEKVIDAVLFRQRTDDILHRFNVRLEGDQRLDEEYGYSSVPVNVYGTIGAGMGIQNGDRVEVVGRLRNNVLLAKDVTVLTNGVGSRVRFRRDLRFVSLLLVLAAVLATGYVVSGYVKQIPFTAVLYFLKIWGIFAAAIAVLYYTLIFSRTIWRNRGPFPIVIILVVALIAAYLFVGKFGIGASIIAVIERYITALLPTILVIALMIYLIKAMFKL